MRRVQAFWTDIGTVHDRVATEEAIRIFEVVETLLGSFVTGINDEAIGLEQSGRAHELIGIPPK
jgi:hypothetical protein